ncbi:uncharacterized protein LOC119353369 isoform X2 [Triticum dicoccoides]|uniref:uncharacterized protein LOC119353369 isoform X2 n=1 Tax=Triticum dicoccoides TaxID=85692 RepID=UPI0018902A9C|nr:uncharacterized protein LOC119353369 isoform X2 [Triticum dicoccoides]
MACALLPAGVAAALPSPRRSAAAPKGQPNQVACTNQLHCKLPLSEPHRSWSLVGCCTCSGSSTGAAMSRRSADAMQALFGVGAIEIDGDDVVTPKGRKIIIK